MTREEREGMRRAGEKDTRGLFTKDNISRDTDNKGGGSLHELNHFSYTNKQT